MPDKKYSEAPNLLILPVGTPVYWIHEGQLKSTHDNPMLLKKLSLCTACITEQRYGLGTIVTSGEGVPGTSSWKARHEHFFGSYDIEKYGIRLTPNDAIITYVAKKGQEIVCLTDAIFSCRNAQRDACELLVPEESSNPVHITTQENSDD